jgi:hypothetical protein
MNRKNAVISGDKRILQILEYIDCNNTDNLEYAPDVPVSIVY